MVVLQERPKGGRWLPRVYLEGRQEGEREGGKERGREGSSVMDGVSSGCEGVGVMEGGEF